MRLILRYVARIIESRLDKFYSINVFYMFYNNFFSFFFINDNIRYVGIWARFIISVIETTSIVEKNVRSAKRSRLMLVRRPRNPIVYRFVE